MRESGFALLEVLIALVILALGLTTLYQSFATGLQGASVTEQHLAARVLAQSILDEHAGVRFFRPGIVRGRHERYQWTLSIAPADYLLPQAQPSHWSLYEFVLTVTWPPGRQIRFETLRLGRPQ